MGFCQANGYRLYYQDQGSGTPVVLIHGLCMDHSMFAEQAAALTAAGYRVITPDLRGHGQSESKAQDYSMEDQAEDLCQLLRHLGIESAHIGGMSMGGMIALRFAVTHPTMTRSVILIDTDAGPEHPMRAAQYEQLAGAFREGHGAAVSEPVMQVLFGQTYLRERPAEARQWQDRIVGLDPVGLFHATRCVTRRTDVKSTLGRIGAPTLILCGDEDVATTPDKSQFMAGAIGGAQLVMVPAAGHSAPVENAAAVTEALLAFLGRA